MSAVLHDWGDDACRQIVHNCRRRIAEDGRLLIVNIVERDTLARWERGPSDRVPRAGPAGPYSYRRCGQPNILPGHHLSAKVVGRHASERFTDRTRQLRWAPSRTGSGAAVAGNKQIGHVDWDRRGRQDATRLALQVASEIKQESVLRVAHVELAALADPELLPHAIVSALGIPEQPGRPRWM